MAKNTTTTQAQRTTPLSPKVPSFWAKNKTVAIVFAVLGFLLYGYSLNCEYVLDDQIVYTDNKFVQKGFSGIGDILKKETFFGYFGEQKDLVQGARYRPLSLITFAIEHQLFKEPIYTDATKKVQKKNKHGELLFLAPPSVGHFNNILLYILSTLLLFRVLSMLFPEEEEENKRPWYFTVPFIASLLFLLHPIHTEAVANIKGRDEILAFIGAFATLYYVLKWQRNNNSTELVKAAIVFFFALLAKENAMTFLAIIPITLYVFGYNSSQQITRPLFYLVAAFLLWFLIRFAVIGYVLSNGKEITDVMNNPFYGMSAGERFATVFYTLGLYIKLLFVPMQLTHDYYPYQIPIMNWGMMESIGSLVLYLILAGIAVWGILKKNVIGYGIAFYLVTLSIVSNVPFSIGTFMNERFIYLSSVGFCLIVAYFLVYLLPKWLGQKGNSANIVALSIVGLLGIGYALKTITRVPDWKNAMSLNTSAIKVSPNSARANLFMGTALFNEAKVKTSADSSRKDQMYAAQQYVQKAVKILPTYYSAIHMLSGLDAEVYAYDKNLDTLLTKFQTYMPYRSNLNIENVKTGAIFMDLYLEYLNTPQNAAKLIPFYKNIIPIFMDKKDYKNALRYLNYALPLSPQDAWLNEQMAKVQTVMPNTQLQQPTTTPTTTAPLQLPNKK